MSLNSAAIAHDQETVTRDAAVGPDQKQLLAEALRAGKSWMIWQFISRR